MGIEEDYLDVLQNIESAITEVYNNNPDLIDAEVASALEALIRIYGAEAQGKSVAHRPVRGLTQQVVEAVQDMCELRLGRGTSQQNIASLGGDPITPDIVVSCLKRLKSSIKLWTQKGGRQGYLDFIRPFLR